MRRWHMMVKIELLACMLIIGVHFVCIPFHVLPVK